MLTCARDQTAGSWDKFGSSMDAWSAKFTDAWNRFAVIGNDVGSLQDCSSLVGGGDKRKRLVSLPMGATRYARYHLRFT